MPESPIINQSQFIDTLRRLTLEMNKFERSTKQAVSKNALKLINPKGMCFSFTVMVSVTNLISADVEQKKAAGQKVSKEAYTLPILSDAFDSTSLEQFDHVADGYVWLQKILLRIVQAQNDHDYKGHRNVYKGISSLLPETLIQDLKCETYYGADIMENKLLGLAYALKTGESLLIFPEGAKHVLSVVNYNSENCLFDSNIDMTELYIIYDPAKHEILREGSVTCIVRRKDDAQEIEVYDLCKWIESVYGTKEWQCTHVYRGEARSIGEKDTSGLNDVQKLSILDTLVKHEDHEAAKQIISEISDLGTGTNNNITALELVLQASNEELLRCLIERGAKINEMLHDEEDKDDDIANTLHVAASSCYGIRALEILAEAYGDHWLDSKSSIDRSLLHYAVDNREHKTAKWLIEQGADINARDKVGITPIDLAATEDEETFHMLWNMGARFNTDNKGWTTLHYAAAGDSIDIFLFLETQTNAAMLHDNEGHSVLDIAAQKDAIAIVDLLASRRVLLNVDNEGQTAFHHAAGNHAKLSFEILLKAYGEEYLDAPDYHGRTPAHVAIQKGHETMAEWLFELGANRDALDEDGHTPMDCLGVSEGM